MTPTLIIGIALVAAAGALVARVIALPRLRALDRIDQITRYGASVAVDLPFGDTGRRDRALDRVAASIGTAVAARVTVIDLEQVRRMLLQAGHYRLRPETFTGYQVLVSLLLTTLVVAGGDMSPLGVLMGIGLVVGGFIVPRFLLQRQGTRRVDAIEDGLPDLIDLLIVTVEAGLSLSSSLNTASRRVEGPLGEELRLAMQEQRMGLPVSDVLQNMLHRSESPSMRSFVRSVVQGETLGVSIGTIMRNLAQEMRQRRRARAEERANKAPVKMLFPLIFLIFPALFIVLLGPAVMEIFDAFGSI